MTQLRTKHCVAYHGATEPLSPPRAHELLAQIEGWTLIDNGRAIRRCFEFTDFYATIAFVNAVAWIAHREDHHPDMKVGYRRCKVRYSTHVAGGLTENDFICAAKVNDLGP